MTRPRVNNVTNSCYSIALQRHLSATSTPLRTRQPIQPFRMVISPESQRSMRSRLLVLLIGLLLPLSLVLQPAPALAAMDYAKQVLIGADFSGREMQGVTFNLTNLREADLSGSDLQGASLFGAKLQDADLSNTNLRDATLDSAVLDGTNLSNAVLEDAFAFNTRFINVTISGADFTNVPLRGDVLKTLCAAAEGTNPVTGRNTRDTLGC
jgi:hypothetical protein